VLDTGLTLHILVCTVRYRLQVRSILALLIKVHMCNCAYLSTGIWQGFVVYMCTLYIISGHGVRMNNASQCSCIQNFNYVAMHASTTFICVKKLISNRRVYVCKYAFPYLSDIAGIRICYRSAKPKKNVVDMHLQTFKIGLPQLLGLSHKVYNFKVYT
jgi:hypothetical protein